MRFFFHICIHNDVEFLSGYPDFIKDINQLDKKYESLKIRSDAYFENTISINYYNLVKNLEKIDEPVNKTAWSELAQLKF